MTNKFIWAVVGIVCVSLIALYTISDKTQIQTKVLSMAYFPVHPCITGLNGQQVLQSVWSIYQPPYTEPLVIDLGEEKTFTAVAPVFWAGDRPEAYSIKTSVDGDAYKTVYTENTLDGYYPTVENRSKVKKVLSVNETKARYIKIVIDKYRYDGTTGQVNLYEFYIYPETTFRNCLDRSVTGEVNVNSNGDMQQPMAELEMRINNYNKVLVDTMNKVSSGGVYYSIYENQFINLGIPVSEKFKPYSDYMSILTDKNICHYVDDLGIKEVWIWSYHTDKVVPQESDMAMGKISQKYWNMPNGGQLKVDAQGQWGDLSNSGHENDLPICEHTYVVYNYIYSAEVDQALHSRLHQIENVLGYLGGNDYCAGGNTDGICVNKDHTANAFWDGFVGKWYNVEQGTWKCGNTHFPPNAIQDYDYWNKTDVTTTCNNKKITINCEAWGCTPMGFYTWWLNQLPKQWWQPLTNLDTYLSTKGKTL